MARRLRSARTMILKLVPTLFAFSLFGCDESTTVDFDSAETGIYEIHSVVQNDTCTWDGATEVFPDAPWRSGVFVDKAEGVLNAPFFSKNAYHRLDLLVDENFASHFFAERNCGSESRETQLLELTSERLVTRRTYDWIVAPECEGGLGALPDATCASTFDEVMYLEEACIAPCEIQEMANEPICVCN